MTLLISGLFLWSAVHFVPSLAPGVKQAAVAKLGENGYKGIFTALMLVSLALIIFGWRGAVPEHLYLLPPATRRLGSIRVKPHNRNPLPRPAMAPAAVA